ncbi:hypothetical protein HRbin18_00738 [bacterium HR18]|nr:hypothetical protein HRbin18_00738 [bacterium HR18]
MANDAPNNWREARRLRAFELSQEGWTGVAIAMALGVTEGVVSQWLRRAREGGKGALRTRKGTGRPPRLAQDKLERLAGLLVQGPEHSGFRGQVWTRARVREVIRGQEVVRFLRHVQRHVGERLLVVWDRTPGASRKARSGVFERGAGADSCGAIAGLCPGAESEGGHLQASEAGRTEEPLLRPPGGVDVGTAPCEGTAAAQALGDRRLLQASRPPLALFVRISKNTPEALFGASCGESGMNLGGRL